MSEKVKRYKRYYDAGWYTKEMLKNLVTKEAITKEEYFEITKEIYTDSDMQQKQNTTEQSER